MTGYATGTRLTLAFTLAAAAASCAPLGADVGDIILGGDQSSLTGEVRSVDTRRRSIRVREDRGREQTVHYDRSTRVVYNRREYPASALEPGDRVYMRLSRDRYGDVWADRVEVRENARDRDRRGDRREVHDRVQRVDGRVRMVDTRRGYFTLDSGRSGTVIVYMPSRPARELQRRFERLRRGDRVQADVRHATRNAAELIRFR